MMIMTRWKEEKKERDAQCHGERHKHFYIVDNCIKDLFTMDRGLGLLFDGARMGISNLPDVLRACCNVNTFKSLLKTHLFSQFDKLKAAINKYTQII